MPVPLIGGPQYFWVTNTGSVDLSSAQYTVKYSISASGLGVGYLELRPQMWRLTQMWRPTRMWRRGESNP
jgi:hypothetical protein